MMLVRTAWLAIALALGGCAATPSRVDPFEPFNRAMFAIHEPIDSHVVRPALQAYVDYVPRAIRQPISNVFNNIDDLFSGLNSLLQGKTEQAGHDFGRVTVNSVMGLGGLIDFASEAGIPRSNEDFGQTFGFWGVPPGPYLFVPLFGPTTVRDGTGFVVRIYLGPVGYIGNVPLRNSLYGLGAVDIRAQALDTQTVFDTAALDRYVFVRRAYLQRRDFLIHDGRPPPRLDDDP